MGGYRLQGSGDSVRGMGRWGGGGNGAFLVMDLRSDYNVN